jgi:hypothetical protein
MTAARRVVGAGYFNFLDLYAISMSSQLIVAKN